MSDYSPDALQDRIRRKVATHRCSVDEAIHLVVDELAAQPEELARWWKVMGPWWLERTQLELHKLGIPPVRSGNGVPLPAVQRSHTETRPSWRDNVAPLDMEMPVGLTGRVKRLGSFDRDDMRAMQDFYEGKAVQLRAEAGRWARMAERMLEGETVEQALERLPWEERALLPGKLRKISAAAEGAER